MIFLIPVILLAGLTFGGSIANIRAESNHGAPQAAASAAPAERAPTPASR